LVSYAQQANEPPAPFKKQVEVLKAYYQHVKEYSLQYAPTPASSGDIADAAISASEDLLNAYISAVLPQVGSIDKAEGIADQVRAKARGFAVRTALEAKYPIPKKD